ncbi:hypothetical protein AKJ51_00090 [candidate division MSBL1 archaeon SCGC-AAA382A20]|uniref:Uncharacterized protein n=1 Tax=candidate division MSBL1 archaeon SCGC-AAA382A20 TaxID=1698280 RepID=A0A133VMV1_9EURY|nr:hypothetical protein AKJ51_00090 [candidate division MSBL1 archaeon SCGC-AAA382A20]
MPNREEHVRHCEELYEYGFEKVHAWMDGTVKSRGPTHRVDRHDINKTPDKAYEIFKNKVPKQYRKFIKDAVKDHIELDKRGGDFTSAMQGFNLIYPITILYPIIFFLIGVFGFLLRLEGVGVLGLWILYGGGFGFWIGIFFVISVNEGTNPKLQALGGFFFGLFFYILGLGISKLLGDSLSWTSHTIAVSIILIYLGSGIGVVYGSEKSPSKSNHNKFTNSENHKPKCVVCGRTLSDDDIREGRERCINCQVEDDSTAMIYK